MTTTRKTVQKTVFPNGLTIVSERCPQFQSLSLGVWVRVGTRHELPSVAGVSHFLEHMLFKGTDRRSALQIAREVDQVGGEFNAFTGREFTCFHILLLNRDMELGVDILSDILLNSKFDPAEMERERKVVLQEISMEEESPEDMVEDLFLEALYGGHGLGRPILGTASSIRRLRRADLLSYFRKHYRPDDIVISAAGDISHQTLCRKLRPLIHGRWPGRPAASSSRRALCGPEPAPVMRMGNRWVVRPTEQVHVVWGTEAPRYTARDRFAASLLNVHVGSGMSSLLFQEIREKHGLAYNVYSAWQPFMDSGAFTVYAATSMHQAPLCLQLIEKCMERLTIETLSEKELKLVKDNLKGTILVSADSAEARMFNLARSEIYLHRNESFAETCERIDAVTAKDLRGVARQLMKGGRSVLALGPRPTKAVSARLRPMPFRRRLSTAGFAGVSR